MNWQLVAKKDVGDAIRQYHLHASVLLFVLLFGIVTYGSVDPSISNVDPDAVAVGLAGLGAFLVPIVAVAFSQGDVVGMRTRGDLKLILGMPFSRRDLVLGSFVGRTVLVWASILAGAVVAVLVALLRGAPVAFGTLLAAIGLLGILGLVFVAIAIAASASVSTETRSGALAMGAFFLFVFRLWEAVPFGVVAALDQLGLVQGEPDWLLSAVRFTANLNPVTTLLDAMYPIVPEVAEILGQYPSDPPFFRTLPFAVVLLALWIVVPLALGYRRFERTDL